MRRAHSRAKKVADDQEVVSRVRGRPPVISNDRLLAVAREVFLERGIRATTAEVAERAGIAEGTVFARFKSKDALFRAAMCVNPGELPPFMREILARAGTGDVRENLIEFATRLLETGRVALPLILMSWSNPGGEFALEKALDRSEGYQRKFRAIRDVFAKEIATGRLGAADPELLARVFMGSLHQYCMSEILLVRDEAGRLSPRAFAEGLVDLLLRATRRARPRPRAPAARRDSKHRTKS